MGLRILATPKTVMSLLHGQIDYFLLSVSAAGHIQDLGMQTSKILHLKTLGLGPDFPLPEHKYSNRFCRSTLFATLYIPASDCCQNEAYQLDSIIWYLVRSGIPYE